MYSQIKLIHIAKTQLGLSDDNYRDILSSFGVSSSKELNFNQTKELLDLFKKMGFEYKKKGESLKSVNNNDYPTQRQLNYILALWMDKAREKKLTSLDKFVKNITGIDRLAWIKKNQVNKVITAIKNLGGSK